MMHLDDVSIEQLKQWLAGSDEFALIDVGEEGEFGLGHLLRAINVPYSRLELLVPPLVPRRTCPVLLIDHGNGIASRARERLHALGYTQVGVVRGGVPAWRMAGNEVFQGIYVPSKAFGEWVEHTFGTPSIDAGQLAELLDANAEVIVLDPRTEAEHAARHVPSAVSCPGGELVYRFDDLVSSPDTLVVVACGGRTRGIVGAQTLINSGVPNRVVALADGNHGWRLAGFELEWSLTDQSVPKRMAILASKQDHCLLDLLWRHRRGDLPVTIPMVISNHTTTAEDVRSFGVPFFHVPSVAGPDKSAAEEEILKLLVGNVDFVVLARYMQILSPEFLERLGVPVINIHHSFLPAFIGAEPYKKAKERGVKLIGATSHYVTGDLDEGPIIEQDTVRVTHAESSAELARRGADVERQVLSRAVLWHAEDRVIRHGNHTIVF